MPGSARVITWAAILMQGYAIWAGFSRSFIWPLTWPDNLFVLYAGVFLLYFVGERLMNGMLTSEFIRKTQLEADQIAAQQIQKTLQPDKLEPWPGYKTEVLYQPFRSVGGDYFDVIDLPDNRTLFALADVSGKGMPAALLAANIQALVRSLATVAAEPKTLAAHINTHLCRYTPTNRFATAVFVVLSRDSGEFVYVNAGHNAPIVFDSGSTTSLDATGVPMGLLNSAQYEAGTGNLPSGGSLLLFTDGLTDSIPGDDPERRLQTALTANPATSVANLLSLVDPGSNQDDITILVVSRAAQVARQAS
jgi:sigma-B regulation protein RsbU (phosphoserine phosphatase)